MSNAVQRSLRAVLLSALILIAASSVTFAQSGSAGGSIGNDEKSLSGSREAPRAVESDRPSRRSRPEADEPRRASRKSGGGGGGNFDGAWIVVAVGCGGSSRTAVVVTSGKIIGEGLTGTISPNGASRSVANSSGITVISTGHASGRNGSGTFRRSDGCSGTWTSSKQ
jgi:hypothetical protein